MRDIKDLLEEMADYLGDRVLNADTEKPIPVPEVTSAFKALSNYYAMTKKLPEPNPEEEKYGWKDAATDTSDGRSRGNGTRPTPDF